MHRILEEIPLFDGVESSILKTISNHFSIRKYKRNNIILREGDKNSYFYIIKAGTVKVYRKIRENQHVILALLQEGEFFGEMSLLEDCEVSANVSCMQPTEVLCLNRSNFKKILKTVPKFSEHLFSHLSQRIRSCDESIENLNRINSFERVGAVLVQLAERSGFRKRSSVIIDKIPFQHNIASLAGTSRETVSRAFAQLEDRKYITKNGRYLVINDYPRFYEEFST